MTVFVTADLGGVAATLGPEPEHFVVDELPLYEPSGEGPHTYLTIEKRNLATFDAVRHLSRALGFDPRNAGTAGLKDRRAVTRQRVSIPDISPEKALEARFDLPPGASLCILDARRHGNKLRTGHLAGNRFQITLALAPEQIAGDARDRAQQILDRLTQTWLPNYYGEQRFGARGDNAERAREILRGGRGPRDQREKRLLLSSLQSQLANAVLDARLRQSPTRQVLAGDVLVRPGSHSSFTCDDVTREQTRVDAGEIVPTLPMFGPKMANPVPGSPAAALEESILAEAHLTPSDFAKAGRLAEGTRREAFVKIWDPSVTVSGDRHLVITFSLPRGSYATVLVAELTKSEGPARAAAHDAHEAPSEEAQDR